ncbi:RNA polymerase sigma factor [Spartinivicinus poritis]|uniref:RNA polymerase sigma factor n=1 Tax=Spartinivicinus poritis TaxID=2994640 RepID=A0ABT5U947_9GAMM|nr:RNA polymerase sigma factor [Spartinivicinus sp. A2-2]MDE1462705.1 RNA polymerase sigma factor [Spartinivicinus sp. A2-2]
MDSFEAHLPRLRRYAIALTGDQHAADDLVQDTLERGWRKLSLFRRGSRLDRWLMTIMHNVFVNQYRRRIPQPDPYHELNEEPSSRATQADALELRDIRVAIAQLPIEQREVLLLVTLEEYSYVDTAKILGIPQGTVMSRLSRARAKLATILANNNNPSNDSHPHSLRIVK